MVDGVFFSRKAKKKNAREFVCKKIVLPFSKFKIKIQKKKLTTKKNLHQTFFLPPRSLHV